MVLHDDRYGNSLFSRSSNGVASIGKTPWKLPWSGMSDLLRRMITPRSHSRALWNANPMQTTAYLEVETGFSGIVLLKGETPCAIG